MRDTRNTAAADASAPVKAPAVCPACRSAEIKTTSKVVTVETYWRCVACGEVWNVGRRGASRYNSNGYYRS